MADFFEECVKLYPDAKTAANWIMGDISAQLKARNASIKELGISPAGLAGILKMIESGSISGKMAKEVLSDAIETRRSPEAIVKEKGLSQISDAAALEEITKAVLEKESKSVNDYKSGKKNAITFLVGQVMRETKGKANPPEDGEKSTAGKVGVA